MSASVKKKYKQKFRKQWLQMEQFNEWLREVPGDSTKAHCLFCRCGIVAKYCCLIKHIESKKHIKSVTLKNNPITHFVEEKSYGAANVTVEEPSSAPAACASPSVVAIRKPTQKEKPSETSGSSSSQKRVVVQGVELSYELQQAVFSLKDKLASLSGQLYITEDHGNLSNCLASIDTTLSLLKKIDLIS